MSNQPIRLDISTPKYPNTYTLIDSDLFKELSKYKWNKGTNGYCSRIEHKNKKYSRLHIHRLIMKAKSGDYVDHINGDKLDNRRCNLRICTNQENQCNRPITKLNTSGYKGVIFKQFNQTWQAKINLNYKTLSVGCYQSKEHAAVAYNIAAKYLFKDFAVLNLIPNESEIADQIKEKVEKRLATYNLIF